MGIFKRTVKDGDHLVVDDRSGFTRWASDTAAEWTGLRVDRRSLDPRHPQELARGRPDRQAVKNPRPPGVTRVTGALTTTTTAAAAAGATSLAVVDTTRWANGDIIKVALKSGDLFSMVINQVVSVTSISLTTPLPDEVESGAFVINMSAIAVTDLGG